MDPDLKKWRKRFRRVLEHNRFEYRYKYIQKMQEMYDDYPDHAPTARKINHAFHQFVDENQELLDKEVLCLDEVEIKLGTIIGEYTRVKNEEMHGDWYGEKGLEYSVRGELGELWFFDWLTDKDIPALWSGFMFANNTKDVKERALPDFILNHSIEVGLRTLPIDADRKYEHVLFPSTKYNLPEDWVVWIQPTGKAFEHFKIVGGIEVYKIKDYEEHYEDWDLNKPAYAIPSDDLKSKDELLKEWVER